MKENKMIELNPLDTPELDKISLPDWMTITLYSPLQKKEVKNLLDNHIWITAYRQKRFVREMSTQHIINCIKCFNGEGNVRIPEGYLGGKEKWLKIFSDELITRQ